MRHSEQVSLAHINDVCAKFLAELFYTLVHLQHMTNMKRRFYILPLHKKTILQLCWGLHHYYINQNPLPIQSTKKFEHMDLISSQIHCEESDQNIMHRSDYAQYNLLEVQNLVVYKREVSRLLDLVWGFSANRTQLCCDQHPPLLIYMYSLTFTFLPSLGWHLSFKLTYQNLLECACLDLEPEAKSTRHNFSNPLQALKSSQKYENALMIYVISSVYDLCDNLHIEIDSKSSLIPVG